MTTTPHFSLSAHNHFLYHKPDKHGATLYSTLIHKTMTYPEINIDDYALPCVIPCYEIIAFINLKHYIVPHYHAISPPINIDHPDQHRPLHHRSLLICTKSTSNSEFFQSASTTISRMMKTEGSTPGHFN